MKLDAPDGQRFVAYAHDFAFIALGGDFQAIRHAVALDDERMITRCRKWIGHSLEQVLAVVFNGRGFAVHHAVIHDHVRAKDVSDALVAQAHAQDRHAFLRKCSDDVVRQTGFPG